MTALNKADLVAAGHTLWQAAAGSGGLLIVADSLSTHGVNLDLLEQGAGVAGAAVLAALGSLVKGYVLQRLGGRAEVAA